MARATHSLDDNLDRLRILLYGISLRISQLQQICCFWFQGGCGYRLPAVECEDWLNDSSTDGTDQIHIDCFELFECWRPRSKALSDELRKMVESGGGTSHELESMHDLIASIDRIMEIEPQRTTRFATARDHSLCLEPIHINHFTAIQNAEKTCGEAQEAVSCHAQYLSKFRDAPQLKDWCSLVASSLDSVLVLRQS
jgi:hypothetical protein